MKKRQNLYSKGKLMFPQLLLLATLFSCSKKDIQDPTLQFEKNHVLEATTATATSSNLIYEETFENGTPFSTYVTTRFPSSYSFTTVTNPVFAGTHSGRFELRDSDPMLHGGTRDEVRFPEQTNQNRWYSFAVYFPSSDYQYDSQEEVINQWHQGSGTSSGASPSISLQTKADRMWLYVKPTPSTTDKIDLGAISKDKWNNMVFHIKHSSGSDGLLELWINGQKVLNRTGANMYNVSSGEFHYPRWNMGIYKHEWNYDNTTDTKKRVLFYDNIRMGNENATYADMASTGTSNSPTPTPVPTPTPTPTPAPAPAPAPTATSSISGFVLVNATTEKDVMTIANGSTVSLSKIGTNKLNIRANAASTVASVQFNLSGPFSYALIDSRLPYALLGDNGSGNYYYGAFKTGSYTLKATPYSGAKATGTASAQTTISFTVVP